MTVFRAQLLAGRAVALGGCADDVRAALLNLGARVEALDASGDPATREDQVGDWARARSPLHAVLYDAAPAFGDGGQAGLRAAPAQAWAAIREVATGALIPGEEGGKVVVIGPGPDAGEFAHAARSALETLVRTLSVEWARYQITATMIAPGTQATPAQVAQLACFLLSLGGDYFSGCRFSLGARATAS
jgi:NAD(P)-dependent dehydrogenase (short-subunit alcohol dehydrogenase family)